jgi:hypothetical protein
MKGRVGVPFSYPYTAKRGFLRVLVWNDSVWRGESSGLNKQELCERLGLGELELFALHKFPELKWEGILMS